MPKRAKSMENMAKHLTKAEQATRAQAEASVTPERTKLKLKAPAYVRNDKAASRYWRDILKRMDGISLLDDLDTEVLGVYCSMLSRRDEAQALYACLAAKFENDDADVSDQMESIMSKLQGQERQILQYADKLGLTPAGRANLARKRAASNQPAAGEVDDLYGD